MRPPLAAREDPRGLLGLRARRLEVLWYVLAVVSVLVFAYGVAGRSPSTGAGSGGRCRRGRELPAACATRHADAARARRRSRAATRTSAGRTAGSSTASSSSSSARSSSRSTPTSPSRSSAGASSGRLLPRLLARARRARAGAARGSADDDGPPGGRSGRASSTTRGPTASPTIPAAIARLPRRRLGLRRRPAVSGGHRLYARGRPDRDGPPGYNGFSPVGWVSAQAFVGVGSATAPSTRCGTRIWW